MARTHTEELYRKDLHDPDNHDGVITHLEPDILECEVKWALESITMNKASGGDGIPALRGEGSCGGGGAPQDSAGSGSIHWTVPCAAAVLLHGRTGKKPEVR